MFCIKHLDIFKGVNYEVTGLSARKPKPAARKDKPFLES